MSARPLGVILTAGRGTRLRPLTPAIPKPLVPLLNRPLISYAFDLCDGLGLTEAVVVTDDGAGATAGAVAALAPPALSVSVVEQREPRGPGDALASAGAALDGRHVVVVAVDTVIRGDLRPQLDAFERSAAIAGLPLHPTDRPREMGIAVLRGDRVVQLEEKPQRPRSDLAVVGIWMLAPEAVERVRTRPVINARGESDLTATVAALLAEGGDVRGWRVDGDWLDAGSVQSLLHAQSRLLAATASGDPADAVAVAPDARVSDSTLTGPVLLGADVVVEGCALGPDVVVGDGARLRMVRLAHALVAPGARLEDATGEGVVVTAAGEIGGGTLQSMQDRRTEPP